MSSHYIYLRCPAPGCATTGTIYTGDVYTERFDTAYDYEGAWIDARCDEHAAWISDDVAEQIGGCAGSRALFPNPGIAASRGEGICRTCLAPIWYEGGTVGHRRLDTGWSDRIEHSGDSLVCFKAVDYRHVPLAGREAAIYDRAFARGGREALLSAADHLDGADAHDLSPTNWTDESIYAAVEHSGPITDWLRVRAEQIGGTP